VLFGIQRPTFRQKLVFEDHGLAANAFFADPSLRRLTQDALHRRRALERYSGIPQHGKPFRRCGNVIGPLRNFEVEVDAAVRLHQTGRSCIAQQFRKLDNGSADKPVGRRRSIM
jgi:hypothetical protein